MLSIIFLLPSQANNQTRHRDASKQPLRGQKKRLRLHSPQSEGKESYMAGKRSTKEKRALGKLGFKIRNVNLLLSQFDQQSQEVAEFENNM